MTYGVGLLISAVINLFIKIFGKEQFRYTKYHYFTLPLLSWLYILTFIVAAIYFL